MGCLDRHNINLSDRLEHNRRKGECPWRAWYESPIWKTIKRHGSSRNPIVENAPPKGNRRLQVTSPTLNTIKVNGRCLRNTITLKVFVIGI